MLFYISTVRWRCFKSILKRQLSETKQQYRICEKKMCVRIILKLRLHSTHGSVHINFFPGTPAVSAKYSVSVLVT